MGSPSFIDGEARKLWTLRVETYASMGPSSFLDGSPSRGDGVDDRPSASMGSPSFLDGEIREDQAGRLVLT